MCERSLRSTGSNGFRSAQARGKLLKGQLALLDQLMADPGLAGLREG